MRWPSPLTDLLRGCWAFYEHLHARRIRWDTLRFGATLWAGALATLLFVVLVVTGVLLMYFYVPDGELAWASVRALEERVRFGRLLRVGHNVAGQLMVLALVAHLVSLVSRRAFERAKLANWVVGVALLLLTVALSYTGYLLPYDQLAYWAVTVGLNMAGSAPVVGGWVQELFFGGAEVGGGTVLRFYVHHCVTLPLVLTGLLGVHLYRIRRDRGLTLAGERHPGQRVRLWPEVLRWELVLAAGTLFAVVLLAWWTPLPLGPLADPSLTPNPVKAPWYLVGLQELLHYHHPFVVSYLVPGAAVGLLAALPLVPRRAREVTLAGLGRAQAGATYVALGAVAVAEAVFAYHVHWALLGTTTAWALSLWLARGERGRVGAWLGRRRWVAWLLLYALVSYALLTAVGQWLRGPNWEIVL